MTKEEILGRGKMVVSNYGEIEIYVKEHCWAAMDAYAEQECIGFAEWKDNNYIEPHKGFGYITFQQYHTIENLSIVPKHTLKELYQLYLKSKQL